MEVDDTPFRPSGDGKRIPMIGLVRVSGSEVGNAFELIEYEGPAVPPPHVHRDRDEAFYVLEGTFRFSVGEEEFDATSGSLVLVRRGTRHGFTTSPSAKALLLVVPAGLEGFFDELGQGLTAGRPGHELRQALAGRYDSEPA